MADRSRDQEQWPFKHLQMEVSRDFLAPEDFQKWLTHPATRIFLRRLDLARLSTMLQIVSARDTTSTQRLQGQHEGLAVAQRYLETLASEMGIGPKHSPDIQLVDDSREVGYDGED